MLIDFAFGTLRLKLAVGLVVFFKPDNSSGGGVLFCVLSRGKERIAVSCFIDKIKLCNYQYVIRNTPILCNIDRL